MNRALLTHTLETVKEIREVARILVVSRDTQALALARQHGALTVLEYGAPALNTALTRATQVARQHVSRSILILPADLPLLTAEDVRTLVEFNRNPPVIVIAPDRHHQGTNALLVNPPGLIEYDFGPGSFQRHCERARLAGAQLEVVETAHLGLDLDMPEDYELVQKAHKDVKSFPLNMLFPS